MENFEFKLDRSFCKAGTHEESSNNIAYWKTKSMTERLAASFYLNSVAYNFDFNNPPRMDKTVFSARKHEKYYFY